jgi:hypothetical protein
MVVHTEVEATVARMEVEAMVVLLKEAIVVHKEVEAMVEAILANKVMECLLLLVTNQPRGLNLTTFSVLSYVPSSLNKLYS